MSAAGCSSGALPVEAGGPRGWGGGFYRRSVDERIRRTVRALSASAIREHIDAAIERGDYSAARTLARELDRRALFVVRHLAGSPA